LKKAFPFIVFIFLSTVLFAKQNVQDSVQSLLKETIKENKFESRKGLFLIYAGIGTNFLKLQAYEDIKISSYLSVGIGTGYRRVMIEDYLPLLANLKLFGMNDTKHITWIMLSGGYCTQLKGGLKSGGYILNPTIGYGFKLSDGKFFTIGLDYDIQDGNFKRQGYVNFDAYGNIQTQYRYVHGNLSSFGIIIGFTY